MGLSGGYGKFDEFPGKVAGGFVELVRVGGEGVVLRLGREE